MTAEDAGISDLLAGPEARRARSSGAAQRKTAAAMAAGARRETLRVDGMWCASCGLVLEDALMALPGVLDAEASYAASLARVTWEPDATELATITERISLLGYSAVPAREAARARADTDELFLRLFVSGVIGMWVMWPTFFVLWPAFAVGGYAGVQTYELFTGALSALVLVYGGWPFLIGAWRAARVRRATMDTLVVLGTWTAWLYSLWATLTSSGPTYFESAAMIATIVLLG
ncbi:MAG: cation transporter, partial [Coriobacteriia bacterium]